MTIFQVGMVAVSAVLYCTAKDAFHAITEARFGIFSFFLDCGGLDEVGSVSVNASLAENLPATLRMWLAQEDSAL